MGKHIIDFNEIASCSEFSVNLCLSCGSGKSKHLDVIGNYVTGEIQFDVKANDASVCTTDSLKEAVRKYNELP